MGCVYKDQPKNIFFRIVFFLTSDCNMKTIQKLLKRKRRDLKSKSFAAFSLPELLVVLVIIGCFCPAVFYDPFGL